MSSINNKYICLGNLKIVSLGTCTSSAEYRSDDYIQKCELCGNHRFVACTKFHDEYGGPKMYYGKWMHRDVNLFDLMYPKK